MRRDKSYLLVWFREVQSFYTRGNKSNNLETQLNLQNTSSKSSKLLNKRNKLQPRGITSYSHNTIFSEVTELLYSKKWEQQPREILVTEITLQRLLKGQVKTDQDSCITLSWDLNTGRRWRRGKRTPARRLGQCAVAAARLSTFPKGAPLVHLLARKAWAHPGYTRHLQHW
jgi:hypothetical protein